LAADIFSIGRCEPGLGGVLVEGGVLGAGDRRDDVLDGCDEKSGHVVAARREPSRWNLRSEQVELF
jgi:hypothetical protein